VLAVVLWGRRHWISEFPSDGTAPTRVNRRRLLYLLGVTIAVLIVLAADLRYAVAPNETFGLAGILWITSIATLLCSVCVGRAPPIPRWPRWEVVLLALLFLLALLSRVWNLTNFPDNIYPDEIMTGTVATQAYMSPPGSPPQSSARCGVGLTCLLFGSGW